MLSSSGRSCRLHFVAGSDPKTAVRRYFDQEATGYLDAYTQASVRGETFRDRRRLVLDMARDPVGRVLDVGAGPGIFTAELLERGGTCVVTDVSVEMLAAAKLARAGDATSARVRYLVADAERLGLRERSFDTVLCVGVLQYLVTPEYALAELARVTRPGGQIVVTFPNARSPLNALHHAVIAMARAGQAGLRQLGMRADADAVRLTFRKDIPNAAFTLSRIDRAARSIGLTVTEILCQGLLFPFTAPGLGPVVAAWNRAARRAPPGVQRRWGREMILRMTRPA